MPSASVVRELDCINCGKPLVKDGKVKCPRCKQEIELPASLPEGKWFCPECPAHGGKPHVLAINSQMKCRWCKEDKNFLVQEEEKMNEKSDGIVSIKVNIFEQLSHLLQEGGITPEDLVQFVPYSLLNPAVRTEIIPEEMRELQLRRLLSLGYPKDIVDSVPVPVTTNCLLVIPATTVPVEQQVDILSMDGRYEDFGDYIRTPDTPYWIYALRCELFKKEFTFLTMRDSLRQRKRRGLTLIEGLNLYAQHPTFFIKPCENEPAHGPSVGFFSSHCGDIAVPGISVWLYNHRPFTISLNSYSGDKGNNDIVVSCTV